MRIFIGSSTEAASPTGVVADLAIWLDELGHEPVRWDEPGLFLPGQHIFARLLEVSKEVDAAILVFAEDDPVWYRNDLVNQPRDNVLLEYGLFAGSLGQRKVIVARAGKSKQPSDLSGIIHLDLSAGKRHLARVQLAHWAMSIDSKKPAGQNNATDAIRLQLLRRMEALGVKDPTLDLFIAVFTNDPELARRGMEAGGDPQRSFGELINSHHGELYRDDQYRELLAKLLIAENKS